MAVSKCLMPEEGTVIGIYAAAGGAIAAALFWKAARRLSCAFNPKVKL